MNNKKSVLFVFTLLILFVAGCEENNSECDAEKDAIILSEIVQRADSLIDIAPDSTLVLCKEFFRKCERGDSLYAAAKLIEGNAYFSIGDLDEAIRSMSEARKLAKRSGDDYTLINATSDLGVMMRVSQKPDSALALYTEALSMIDGDLYIDEKAHLLTSIAILYANTGHLEEARDYAVQSVETAKKSQDADMIMYASSQAGAIYNLLGDSDKALQLTREAIADARCQNLPRYELKAIGHMIDIQLKAGNRDSVDYYLNRGEELIGEFTETSVEGLGFLEEKYVVLSAMKRFRESIAIQRHLLSLQTHAPAFMPIEKLWLRMARNYRGLDLPDSMAICYERSIELADSARGANTDQQLSKFYARFKTAEKELALANTEREKARSDTWLTITLSIVLILVVMLIAGIQYLRVRRRKEQILLLKSHLLGVEKERGRLAKDLHDGICNDLYGIEMLLQTDTNRGELLENVEKIRADVRRISHEMMPPALQEVGLSQAIEAMTAKISKADNFVNIVFRSNSSREIENIPQNIAYEIYRISQELLGNIIRHSRPKNIAVSLEVEYNVLTLKISHDNPPADNAVKSHDGVGLKSIYERMSVIGATAEGLPYSDKITVRCRID